MQQKAAISRGAGAALTIFSLFMASGCVQQAAVHHGASRPAVARSRPAPAFRPDIIRPGAGSSQQISALHEQARAALLTEEPELAAMIARVEQAADDREEAVPLAAAYIRHRLYRSAYDLLLQLQIAYPQDTAVDLGLAAIWDAWGQFDLAAQHAGRAIANGEHSAKAFQLLGRTQLHLQAPAQAAAAFLQANQSEAGNPDTLAGLGYAYLLNGELQPARLYLEQAVLLDGSQAEVQNNLAMVLAQSGDYDGAFEHLLAAARPAVALNNLGVLHLRQQHFAEAQRLFEKSLRLEPSYENARRNLQSARAAVPPPAILELAPAVAAAPLPRFGPIGRISCTLDNRSNREQTARNGW